MLEHVDITPYSAFKTKSFARYFFSFEEKIQIPSLLETIKFARSENLPVIILWSGTNCLFAFDVFEGLVIRNVSKGFTIQGNFLTVASGEFVSTVANALFSEHHIRTFLPWIWLPGTFWGAIVGNAGCFWLEVKDIFLDIDVCDLETGEIKTLTNQDLGFAYRHSNLKEQDRYFILSARFDLAKSFPDNVFTATTPQEMQKIRRAKQPIGLSCGSFFKNPSGDSAGRIIDKELHMNGTRLGSVQISPSHGNFFLANPGARWQDILELSQLVKINAKERLWINLQEEVRIIHNFSR